MPLGYIFSIQFDKESVINYGVFNYLNQIIIPELPKIYNLLGFNIINNNILGVILNYYNFKCDLFNDIIDIFYNDLSIVKDLANSNKPLLSLSSIINKINNYDPIPNDSSYSNLFKLILYIEELRRYSVINQLIFLEQMEYVNLIKKGILDLNQFIINFPFAYYNKNIYFLAYQNGSLIEDKLPINTNSEEISDLEESEAIISKKGLRENISYLDKQQEVLKPLYSHLLNHLLENNILNENLISENRSMLLKYLNKEISNVNKINQAKLLLLKLIIEKKFFF
jgi:hypothetical protein